MRPGTNPGRNRSSACWICQRNSSPSRRVWPVALPRIRTRQPRSWARALIWTSRYGSFSSSTRTSRQPARNRPTTSRGRGKRTPSLRTRRSSRGASPSTSSSLRWANPAAMMPRSPAPSIRLKGASSAQRSMSASRSCKARCFSTTLRGTGTNRQGSRTRPEVGLRVRPLGDVDRLGLLDEAPGDRARSTAVWSCSETSKAACIMAKPSAGVAGSSQGISSIGARGRVSWSFCEP